MKYAIAKLSLSFMWLFTGITSISIVPHIGFEILTEANMIGMPANLVLYSGGLVDILVGIWLLTAWQEKYCYLAQMLLIATFTVLVSLIAPSYWLHPFGSITKNIPILCLIGILYCESKGYRQAI